MTVVRETGPLSPTADRSGRPSAKVTLSVPRARADRPSRLTRLPAHGKLLALLTFVLVVVATPAASWWAFGCYFGLLLGCLAYARLAPLMVARRCLVELPFLVFAAVLPFVALGPRVEVFGLSLARDGLIGGATLACKATLGVLAAVLLASTTSPRDLLVGLEKLRLPSVFVAIVSFMLRYAGVLRDDLQRMRVARLARGGSDGAAARLVAVAGAVGSVFVRSFERGERVQVAMFSRGYTGSMPRLSQQSTRPGDLLICALLPAAASVVLLVTLVQAR